MYVAHKHDGKIFFDTAMLPSKCVVMNRLGARENSFAGNVVSRLYDFYFYGAEVFCEEYKKYYKKEFKSLVEFIEQRYDIEKEEAVKYSKGKYAVKDCSRMSIERNIYTLNYDDNFKKIFSDAIGGILDEDKDGLYY